MATFIDISLNNILKDYPDWKIEYGTLFFAQPAGLMVKKDYEQLRDEILTQLESAGQVSAVEFILHGSMMAEGYDDCEGDILKRARRIVGNQTPVGIFLDPHGHTTKAMTDLADLIVIMKEYPHTDIIENIEKLTKLLIAGFYNHITPRISVFNCRQISMYHTTREPMRFYVGKLNALEGKDGVLSISVTHGFPWGDNPDLGTKILVITDNDTNGGNQLSEGLGKELIGHRGSYSDDLYPMDDGLKKAVPGPVLQKLIETLDHIYSGQSAQFKNWLTPLT